MDEERRQDRQHDALENIAAELEALAESNRIQEDQRQRLREGIDRIFGNS